MEELLISENQSVNISSKELVEQVRASVKVFSDAMTKSKAYYNLLASEAVEAFLREKGLLHSQFTSLHSSMKLLGDFELADIQLPNLSIDVRAVFDEKELFKETITSLGIFRTEIKERIENKEVNLTQIYRNFLLSETYGIDQNKKAYSIVLAPQEHPTTGDEVNSLKNELKEEYRYKISSVNLEDFVLKLIEKSQGKYQATFRAFYDRYLNFEKTK